MQTKTEEFTRVKQCQQLEPIAILGGNFTGAQRNWTKYEKKVYEMVKTSGKMGYVFWRPQPVHSFTDHRKFLYVLALSELRPNSPRNVLWKVHRWSIHFSRFEFFINRIDGTKNIFADMLTRWSMSCRKTTTWRVAALYGDIIPEYGNIKSVTIHEIVDEQHKHKPPDGIEKGEHGAYMGGA